MRGSSSLQANPNASLFSGSVIGTNPLPTTGPNWKLVGVLVVVIAFLLLTGFRKRKR